MSENIPETPLERGTAFLAKNENGKIEVVNATGQSYDKVIQDEVIPSQHELARELSQKFLRGDKMLGIFGGKIVETTIIDQTENSNGDILYTVAYGDGTKDVLERAFTPEIQADLARRKAEQDLADTSLEGAGMNDPEATPEVDEVDPYDNLPDEVKQEVDRYKMALSFYKESVDTKDFSQAARDKERMYEIGQGLSPAAKAYLELM